MIKHDYKAQNNKRFFNREWFKHLPLWTTHPFSIISMAILVTLLAYFLSDNSKVDHQTGQLKTVISKSSLSRDAAQPQMQPVNSGEIKLTLSATNQVSSTSSLTQ